jgi:hypothetical protein
MLNIKHVLGGLSLSAIVCRFKPNLVVTYITLVSRLVAIKPLSYFY